MSWTEECLQSNCFKTKDPNEVMEVLQLLGLEPYLYDNGTIEIFGNAEGGAWLDESAEVVLSIKPFEEEEGKTKNLHGIISDYSLCSVTLEELAEEFYTCEIDNIHDHVMVVPLIEYLQDELLDGEVIEITCAGFEGRSAGTSNPFGYAEVITKTKHVSSSLTNLLEELRNFD